MSGTTAPNEVRIARAIHAALEAALLPSEIPVGMERADVLSAEHIPCAQIYRGTPEVVSDFIGGRQMVLERFVVECIADVGEGEESAVDRPAESGYSALVMLEQCRNALLADRTLGGVAISLETTRGEPGRSVIDEEVTTARSEALVVSVYHIRDRS